jgi:hypothetical protein
MFVTAVMDKVFVVPPSPLPRVMFAGGVRKQWCLGTFIVCDFVEVLPQSSEAVQVLLQHQEPAH